MPKSWSQESSVWTLPSVLLSWRAPGQHPCMSFVAPLHETSSRRKLLQPDLKNWGSGRTFEYCIWTTWPSSHHGCTEDNVGPSASCPSVSVRCSPTSGYPSAERTFSKHSLYHSLDSTVKLSSLLLTKTQSSPLFPFHIIGIINEILILSLPSDSC